MTPTLRSETTEALRDAATALVKQGNPAGMAIVARLMRLARKLCEHSRCDADGRRVACGSRAAAA